MKDELHKQVLALMFGDVPGVVFKYLYAREGAQRRIMTDDLMSGQRL
jgi:hypothetical protein